MILISMSLLLNIIGYLLFGCVLVVYFAAIFIGAIVFAIIAPRETYRVVSYLLKPTTSESEYETTTNQND